MFGIDIFDPETMWLNITNIALGVVTLLSVGIVAWGVLSEVADRIKVRSLAPAGDDHAFAFHGLGVTMADGGTKVDEEKKK